MWGSVCFKSYEFLSWWWAMCQKAARGTWSLLFVLPFASLWQRTHNTVLMLQCEFTHPLLCLHHLLPALTTEAIWSSLAQQTGFCAFSHLSFSQNLTCAKIWITCEREEERTWQRQNKFLKISLPSLIYFLKNKIPQNTALSAFTVPWKAEAKTCNDNTTFLLPAVWRMFSGNKGWSDKATEG